MVHGKPAIVARLASLDCVYDKILERSDGPSLCHEVQGDVVSDLLLRANLVASADFRKGLSIEPIDEELECTWVVLGEKDMRPSQANGFGIKEAAG